MPEDIRKIVRDNLNASKENGYFEPGEQLHNISEDDLIIDMQAYAEDCSDLSADALRPHVREWLKENPTHA